MNLIVDKRYITRDATIVNIFAEAETQKWGTIFLGESSSIDKLLLYYPDGLLIGRTERKPDYISELDIINTIEGNGNGKNS